MTQQELADIYRRSEAFPIGWRRGSRELGILKADSEAGRAAGIKEDMCIFLAKDPETGEQSYMSTQQRIVRIDTEIHANDELRRIQEQERKRQEDRQQEEIHRRKFPYWYDEYGNRLPDEQVWEGIYERIRKERSYHAFDAEGYLRTDGDIRAIVKAELSAK